MRSATTYFKNGMPRRLIRSVQLRLGPISALCLAVAMTISPEARATLFEAGQWILSIAESWVLRGLLE
jgi:hypothetical protein